MTRGSGTSVVEIAHSESARFQMNPTPGDLVDLRRRVVGHRVVRQLDPPVQGEMMLLLSELATNAIEAARPGSPITVDVTLDNEAITVCVENFGPPFFLPLHPELPSGEELRGRGLAIAAALADAVHSEHLSGRTRVIAVRRHRD